MTSESLKQALQDVSTIPNGVGLNLWVVIGKTTGQRVGVFGNKYEADIFCAERNAKCGLDFYKVEERFFPRSIQ